MELSKILNPMESPSPPPTTSDSADASYQRSKTSVSSQQKALRNEDRSGGSNARSEVPVQTLSAQQDRGENSSNQLSPVATATSLTPSHEDSIVDVEYRSYPKSGATEATTSDGHLSDRAPPPAFDEESFNETSQTLNNKKPWTLAEEAKLVKLVASQGSPIIWEDVSKSLHRSRWACESRWYNYLKPDPANLWNSGRHDGSPWQPEEDSALCMLATRYGRQWDDISCRLTHVAIDRSPLDCCERWYRLAEELGDGVIMEV